MRRFEYAALVATAAISFTALHCEPCPQSEPCPRCPLVTCTPPLKPVPVDSSSEQETGPAPAWAVVTDLSQAEGRWIGVVGEPLVISSRERAIESGRQWHLPYPWRLRAGGVSAVDCGLHEELVKGSWYIGYCEGFGFDPGRRTASRVSLELLGDELQVTIGALPSIVYRRDSNESAGLDASSDVP